MSDWEIKAAIKETIDGYAGAAAKRDVERYVSYFTEEGELVNVAKLMGQADPLVGRSAIHAFISASFEGCSWLEQQNTTTQIILGPDKTSATASTSFLEFAQPKEGPQVMVIARYDDELKLVDGRWLFSRRVLTPHRFSSMP